MKQLLIAIMFGTLVGCPPPPDPPEWEVTRVTPCIEVVKYYGTIFETRDLEHGMICVRLSNGWTVDVNCVNVEPTCTVRAGKAVMIDGS